MNLLVRRWNPDNADCEFVLQARGFLAASLHWANAEGPLPDWTALAYVPLDISGCGCFRYTGGRAIPPEATHVAARLISPDFAHQAMLLEPLPQPRRAIPADALVRLAVMSDLHLSSQPGRIRRALRLARSADCVLMAGDLTNDGLPDQFHRLLQCMDEEIPETPVLAVTGNHDYPARPLPLIMEGEDVYPLFQERLLARAEALGVKCTQDASGAFRARLRGVTVFGLNAATHFRRFTFPEKRQLYWLREQLAQTAERSVVLCHAPLRLHQPMSLDEVRNAPPYLGSDTLLQEIVDEAGSVCFVSGHTHISFNDLKGCVELDAARQNIYLNDASVTLSMLRRPECLTDRAWVDGVVTLLTVFEDAVEIAAWGVSAGKRMARGYYRLPWRRSCKRAKLSEMSAFLKEH